MDSILSRVNNGNHGCEKCNVYTGEGIMQLKFLVHYKGDHNNQEHCHKHVIEYEIISW